MHIRSLCQAVLTATFLLSTFVTASPFGIHAGYMNLRTRDLFVDSTCTPFVYGATNVEIGTICVSIMDGKLYIRYTITSDKCSDISVVHAWVGTGALPDRNPGGFPYSSDGQNPECTVSGKTAECIVDVDPSWRVCEGTLKIATHAAITCTSGSETGWGMGPCFPGSNGNCAKFWTFTTHCQCPVFSVYPQEYSTSTTTYTSTSTTSYLTSTTIVITTSTTSEYETTSYSDIEIVSESTSTLPRSTLTTTTTCLSAYPYTIILP